ncbi:MAG: beta-N-acetylhexosaminidase [Pseudomonadota bacterium]
MSGPDRNPPKALILGCRGTVLSEEERRFFREANPLGFILFERNCAEPGQVRALVSALRLCVGRETAPVLIDQEGGRVQRLRPPHWREAPAMARFGRLAETKPEAARKAVWLNGRLLAGELAELGISVDCAPVLDLLAEGADPVIGDRAFGNDASLISSLGRALCEGLLAGGVLPVLKHIPGHGRAQADSHKALPRVEASEAELVATDFLPFRELADMPLAMTAHIVYAAFDRERPATLSPAVVSEVIRRRIGFDGFLMTDDIAMGALGGPLAVRAGAAIAAGCDAILHCNGRLDEMAEIAAAVGPLDLAAAARLARAERRRSAGREGINLDRARSEFAELMGGVSG